MDALDSGAEQLDCVEESLDGAAGGDHVDAVELALVEETDDVGDVGESAAEGLDSDLVIR